MVFKAYLTIVGQKQGEIRGSETLKGREGQIAIISATHEVSSPRDAQSGLPIGARLHKPFVITKELDASTPLLYRAFVSNENISTWELRFWAQDSGIGNQGSIDFECYRIRLTNANIADFKFSYSTVVEPNIPQPGEYEEIAFTYQKIEWAWVVGDDVVAQDSWEANN
jgi:type VI secretion system secreted protein Hcp